jgi:hypothetical protein
MYIPHLCKDGMFSRGAHFKVDIYCLKHDSSFLIATCLLAISISHCSFFYQTAKILLFYIIFYAALSGFFAAMLAVFYQTLHPKMPKWKLEESIIGTNPGE